MAQTQKQTVAVTKANSRAGSRTTCHEIIEVRDDGTVQVGCNADARYREVSVDLYPHRTACENDGCWIDGVPDWVEAGQGAD